MRTNVYVDGFNLYYGSLKGTPHRWLDLDALCARMLPRMSAIRLYRCVTDDGFKLADPSGARENTYASGVGAAPARPCGLPTAVGAPRGR